MVSLILGWDGLGVVSYLLVIFYFRFSSRNSGAITFLRNRVGDVFFIFSIALLILAPDMSVLGKFPIFLISFAIFICFITKSAQFPYSVWLPAAMAAPTPVSSLVHSSTLVTAGVFLFVRFNGILRDEMFNLLFLLGILTCLYAGLMALTEMDLKKVIALSTLRQLGFMMMSLGLGLIWLGFYHLLTHAIFKARLFFTRGVFIHNLKRGQDYRLSLGFGNKSPGLSSVGAVCTLCLVGFPFSVGFYTKDLILDIFINKLLGKILTLSYITCIFITLLYMARFCYLLFWSEQKPQRYSYNNENYLPNLGAVLLFSLVLIWGGATVIINFNGETRVLVSQGWKLAFILILVTFLVIPHVLSQANKLVRNNKYFGSIIKLPYFSRQLLQGASKPWGDYMYNLGDKGLLEYWGAQGTHKFLTTVNLKLYVLMRFTCWLMFISFVIWMVYWGSLN